MAEGIVQSNELCPLCLLQNNVQSKISTRPGQFYSSCTANHRFEDTEELRNLQVQARAKFPHLFGGAKTQTDNRAALEAQDVYIDPENRKAIQEMTGQFITSGADIKGMLYALTEDNKDKEAEIKTLRTSIAMAARKRQAPGAEASGPLGMGQFIITVPEWALEGVAAQSAANGKSPEEWLSEEFFAYYETYFGQPLRSA